jgi:hypothetical protein
VPGAGLTAPVDFGVFSQGIMEEHGIVRAHDGERDWPVRDQGRDSGEVTSELSSGGEGGSNMQR